MLSWLICLQLIHHTVLPYCDALLFMEEKVQKQLPVLKYYAQGLPNI